MFSTLMQVALGGAIGAASRYLAGVAVLRVAGPTPFPLAILSVNVVGSFLMGLCAVLVVQRGFGAWQPLVMTGVLGGFTTFSAFSLETMTLIERGDMGQAVLYVALSVGLSVGGLALGLMVARGIWA